MIFGAPTPFQEAIDSVRGKHLLPNDLTSEQLSALPAEVREAANFAAGVTKAEILQKFDDVSARIAGGATEEDFARRDAGKGPLLLDRGAARAELKRFLRDTGYQAKPGEEGTIKDLSSSRRINLILDTRVAMAQGRGNYIAGQTPAALDLTPCWEFIRVSRRRVPRKDWPLRWRAAGGKTYGGGRMIAAKDDPVWRDISRFGLPYAPFDFNSGMGTRNIRRTEAVALGVIPEDYQVQPAEPNELLGRSQASAAAFGPAVREALTNAGYVIRDGVVTANSVPTLLWLPA